MGPQLTLAIDMDSRSAGMLLAQVSYKTLTAECQIEGTVGVLECGYRGPLGAVHHRRAWGDRRLLKSGFRVGTAGGKVVKYRGIAPGTKTGTKPRVIEDRIPPL
jgi:hypothetical protein